MKVVLQDGIKDCGVCCLLSIIRYYGGDVSKEYLRELTNTTKDGVSFYNLINGSKQIGFDAIGLSGKLENIDVNNLPCIVHFVINKTYKHFVVLYEINIKKHQVTLMDPAKGKKTISFSEFNLLTSNNYIFLKPVKKLPIINKRKIILKNIKLLLIQNKKTLLFILILTLSYFILSILSAFHFKYLLEYSIKYNYYKNLYIISYIMIGLYLLKNINELLKNTLLNKLLAIFDIETTTATYKQVLLLPYLYYKNRTAGEVISRFKDLNTIRSFICILATTLITDSITIIIFSLIMLRINKNLTYMILLILFINIIYTLLFNKKKRKLLTEISKGEDTINSYLIQGISNVDTIKGSHLEKRLIDKFSINYKAFQEKIYNYKSLVEKYLFLNKNNNDLLYIVIYGLGSYYVITKKLSLSNLIVYQSFYMYFINCFIRLINILEQYNSYKIALNRVEEIFMITNDNFKNNYYYLPYQLSGDIIYKNLNYQIGSRKIINNLQLTIKKGEKILLCGDSGSGKSTLVKMLLRYIEVPFDNIKIAGIDINHYHLENIRANITYVTNNEYLFNDTIRNNILLYKDYPEEDFLNACSICLVNDIIKDDKKYDSLIEENGFNISNGERQRIILARSILRKSNIYIFDEAFAGIDINKEKKILKNIFEYLHDKTIIIISHRFNNKKEFDRVLKLEKGKIYES